MIHLGWNKERSARTILNTDLYIKEISIQKEIPKEDYINALPVVSFLKKHALTFEKPVSFLVGENGIGKSTLIEAIAISLGFNPEGGSKNFCFSTENSHSDLHEYLSVVKGIKRPLDGYFLRAESFYNVATNIDELDRAPAGAPAIIESYGGVSLHRQSHGESFMTLIEERFGGNGIYILDEPEAALSPMRLMRLLYNINRLVQKNSQFMISTHSPILMAFPNADVFEITETGIQKVSYQETEHYQVTKRFLEDPQRMLHYLLDT